MPDEMSMFRVALLAGHDAAMVMQPREQASDPPVGGGSAAALATLDESLVRVAVSGATISLAKRRPLQGERKSMNASDPIILLLLWSRVGAMGEPPNVAKVKLADKTADQTPPIWASVKSKPSITLPHISFN